MKLAGNIKNLQYETEWSAGFDLRSTENIVLPPGEWYPVPTGVYIEEADANEFLAIVPRSGLAVSEGITVLNAPGTIDADYPGEIKVILINFGDDVFPIEAGDRIAQGILMERKLVKNIKVSSKVREGGLGHTGVK